MADDSLAFNNAQVMWGPQAAHHNAKGFKLNSMGGIGDISEEDARDLKSQKDRVAAIASAREQNRAFRIARFRNAYNKMMEDDVEDEKSERLGRWKNLSAEERTERRQNKFEVLETMYELTPGKSKLEFERDANGKIIIDPKDDPDKAFKNMRLANKMAAELNIADDGRPLDFTTDTLDPVTGRNKDYRALTKGMKAAIQTREEYSQLRKISNTVEKEQKNDVENDSSTNDPAPKGNVYDAVKRSMPELEKATGLPEAQIQKLAAMLRDSGVSEATACDARTPSAPVTPAQLAAMHQGPQGPRR